MGTDSQPKFPDSGDFPVVPCDPPISPRGPEVPVGRPVSPGLSFGALSPVTSRSSSLRVAKEAPLQGSLAILYGQEEPPASERLIFPLMTQFQSKQMGAGWGKFGVKPAPPWQLQAGAQLLVAPVGPSGIMCLCT